MSALGSSEEAYHERILVTEQMHLGAWIHAEPLPNLGFTWTTKLSDMP